MLLTINLEVVLIRSGFDPDQNPLVDRKNPDLKREKAPWRRLFGFIAIIFALISSRSSAILGANNCEIVEYFER